MHIVTRELLLELAMQTRHAELRQKACCVFEHLRQKKPVQQYFANFAAYKPGTDAMIDRLLGAGQQ